MNFWSRGQQDVDIWEVDKKRGDAQTVCGRAKVDPPFKGSSLEGKEEIGHLETLEKWDDFLL